MTNCKTPQSFEEDIMHSKRNTIITVLAVFLILLSLTGTLFLSEKLSSRIMNIITVATAVIGAIALFLQFKKDKNLNEAGFLVDYSAQFYNTYDCGELMNELEKCRADATYTINIEKYYRHIVGYLEWIETLAALVNSGLLSLERIDDVMSYRFFIMVNNKQIQEYEIVPSREFYRGTYILYRSWSAYKKKRGMPVIFAESELSETEGYSEIVSSKK